ncbi:MAG: pepsin/retropepsin-like aspartic protease family protein, partial [Polyangiaceae bacterium]
PPPVPVAHAPPALPAGRGAGGVGLPPAPTPAAPARDEKRALLRFELSGRKFPIPLVHVSVAGKPTWMFVDTGSASHVLAGWLARRAGLSMKKRGNQGVDHAGRTIAEYRVENPHMTIDGWGPVADGPMIATEVPPFYEEHDIGGFVSPQQLVPGDGDAVVLDLSAGEMRASRYDEAIHKLGHHGSSLAPNGGRICTADADPTPAPVFVVPATIEKRAVDLLVDTGSERSDLLSGSSAGKALASRSVANKEDVISASGRMTSRTVPGATISVGDFAVRTDVRLIAGVADPDCPRDGVVSMDVLRSCVLVLGKTTMSGRCGAR